VPGQALLGVAVRFLTFHFDLLEELLGKLTVFFIFSSISSGFLAKGKKQKKER